MIFILILIIIIIICIRYIYEMQKFNHMATLIQLQNPNKSTIMEILNEKSPIIIHNLISKYIDLEEFTLQKLIQKNPGYIVKDNILIFLEKILKLFYL